MPTATTTVRLRRISRRTTGILIAALGLLLFGGALAAPSFAAGDKHGSVVSAGPFTYDATTGILSWTDGTKILPHTEAVLFDASTSPQTLTRGPVDLVKAEGNQVFLGVPPQVECQPAYFQFDVRRVTGHHRTNLFGHKGMLPPTGDCTSTSTSSTSTTSTSSTSTTSSSSTTTPPETTTSTTPPETSTSTTSTSTTTSPSSTTSTTSRPTFTDGGGNSPHTSTTSPSTTGTTSPSTTSSSPSSTTAAVVVSSATTPPTQPLQAERVFDQSLLPHTGADGGVLGIMAVFGLLLILGGLVLMIRRRTA